MTFSDEDSRPTAHGGTEKSLHPGPSLADGSSTRPPERASAGHAFVLEWKDSWVGLRWFFTAIALLLYTVFLFSISVMQNGPFLRVNRRNFASLGELYHRHPGIVLLLFLPIVGGVCTYVVLAMRFNRTVISVDPDTLSVTCGPLPWPRADVRVKRGTLRALDVQEYESHTDNDQPVMAYRILAKRGHGYDEVLVKGIQTDSEARKLQRWIQRSVGLPETS